ncbi:TPA: tail fiber assembly protein [Escherichia coli]|uniref:tail fiber assembly protein n=1 Tax=Escherichia coli TaxID=562 RepID=UPI000BE981CB|nr:tail fiber assembly protein [Escherichia coli]HBE4986250.1 tail fiber assembly protein [Escherichia coli]
MMNADLAILENGIATTAGWITIYNYSAVTGEYLDSNSEYIPEGVGLPALATDIEPPNRPDGQAVIWQGSWILMDDWRGETVYSIFDGSASIVDYLGAIAEGYTQQKPATRFDKWDGKQWVTDTDARNTEAVAVSTQQKAALLAEATATIAPLQDAKDGGYIDDADIPMLISWQKYRYALTKVNPKTPVWPSKPSV